MVNDFMILRSAVGSEEEGWCKISASVLKTSLNWLLRCASPVLEANLEAVKRTIVDWLLLGPALGHETAQFAGNRIEETLNFSRVSLNQQFHAPVLHVANIASYGEPPGQKPARRSEAYTLNTARKPKTPPFQRHSSTRSTLGPAFPSDRDRTRTAENCLE
jgi:hypothetical protein